MKSVQKYSKYTKYSKCTNKFNSEKVKKESELPFGDSLADCCYSEYNCIVAIIDIFLYSIMIIVALNIGIDLIDLFH